MGWCSGTDIYLAAAQFEDLIDFEYIEVRYIDEAFDALINKLEDSDWDCKDEALEQLNRNSHAYKRLAVSMDLNPDCKGKCFEIRCEGKDECGCVCHY